MDVASVRGLYSGLSDGWTYLNAHDTPQIAERLLQEWRVLSACLQPLQRWKHQVVLIPRR